MFSSSVQPALVSLFSSTGSDPLALFASHTDPSLPSDSFICLLHDSSSAPAPPPPRTLIKADEPDENDASSPDYTLDQTVLHVQSPTLRTTYIRSPPAQDPDPGRHPSRMRGHLGLKHPWMHLQVRNMGKEWAFECGVVDQTGREGVVRCATFQKQPRLKLSKSAILLLPLSFPPASSRPLTSWSTISLNLPSLLPHFSSAALLHESEQSHDETSSTSPTGASSTPIPSGVYSHVSYVKVYSTCRLRRIWFSESGAQQRLPWDFQLYAADDVQ